MSVRGSLGLVRHWYWLLSILFHFLLFLSFTLVIHFQTKKNLDDKKPYLEVPSYVYHEPSSAVPQKAMLSQPEKRQMASATQGSASKSPMTQYRQTQTEMDNHPIDVTKSQQQQQPVHMIGDKKVDKPLIKLLGTALSAHLSYPKVAIDFRLRGTALVGFNIHPDGQVTEVRIVKSSGIAVLDQAALHAASSMSPVRGVSHYLKGPTFLVVGIIFG